MDRRIVTLIVAAGLAVALVAGVVIARSGGGDSGSAGSDLTRPQVNVPKGPPPKQLTVKDLVNGKGTTAKTGDTLTIQYVGVDYASGQEFDATWDRNQPFTFKLGSGQVIPGWGQGIPGMRVGGRRELTIPPNLAYGAQGSPPAIGPNATLVFVIDLLSVK